MRKEYPYRNWNKNSQKTLFDFKELPIESSKVKEESEKERKKKLLEKKPIVIIPNPNKNEKPADDIVVESEEEIKNWMEI